MSTSNSTIEVLPLSIAVSDFYATTVPAASCLASSFLNYGPPPAPPLDSGLRRNDDFGGRPARLEGDGGLHVAGGEGVHVGYDEVPRAVADELGLVLPADYGEGAEDVAGGVSGWAGSIEMLTRRASWAGQIGE